MVPLDVYRMKNNNPFMSGIPDAWYSSTGRDLWVEYKWLAVTPKKIVNLTTGKKPALSVLQQDWLRKRHNEGRNVGVVVGFPTGGKILRNLSWEHDWSADGALTRREIADWITNECNTSSTHSSKNNKPNV
jgi:hypothetical protein